MALVMLAWYAIGVASFVYWWTSEFDLKPQDVAFGAIVGIVGPFVFLLGWIIHGDSLGNASILMKKRKPK